MMKILAACLTAVGILAAGATFADSILPVPRVVIYPRDPITDDMLQDQTYNGTVDASGYVTTRAALVGRLSRLTLLPGRPIPANAIEAPRLVSIGNQVKIIFNAGGVTILAVGLALQGGAAGDVIRVRNSDTGLIISGSIQPNGSVRVGDS